MVTAPSLSFSINSIPEGLGVAFVCVPSISRGAWHMVGLGEYLWDHFLPTSLFVVSNTGVQMTVSRFSMCALLGALFSLEARFSILVEKVTKLALCVCESDSII